MRRVHEDERRQVAKVRTKVRQGCDEGEQSWTHDEWPILLKGTCVQEKFMDAIAIGKFYQIAVDLELI